MPKASSALTQLSPSTVAALEQLGADLAVARLRRKESLKTWSKRIGIIDKPTRLSIMEYLFFAGDDRFGGAQPKALIDVPLVEHASMTLAQWAGLQP